MDGVIQILREKNSYLERFYSINEVEIINFAEGNFDNLDEFYNSRAAVLEMIHSADKRLEGINLKLDVDSTKISDEDKKTVLSELSIKNEFVQRILAQDLQILSYIESAKSEIIKELSQVKTIKKAVGSYHSGMRDKIIDEKI